MISSRETHPGRGTMSDAYKQVKTGRLTFKGGELAAGKGKKKKKNKDKKKAGEDGSGIGEHGEGQSEAAAEEAGGEVYTIDAAKRMKYEELFPVETKKFGYDPANSSSRSAAKSVEGALDDRVRKKADRYCK